MSGPIDLWRTHRRAAWALIALACVASVAGALYTQHHLDMQPCPWCILQRVIYLAIALVALVAAALPPQGLASRAGAVPVVALAAAGAAAALYQNQVAAKLPSCDLTLADRIVSGLGLDAWQPEVFEVRASCAEAAVSLAGVPFELWSLMLFAGLGLAAALLAGRPSASATG